MVKLKQRIPLVLPGHALRSLRNSGYSIADALGEAIDNCLEANANIIRIFFAESQNKKGRKHIHRISIIDDGDGMEEDILHQYLQLGFSTRYMRSDTIGKYGVGAKLAALNYAQRIDVWSRTTGNKPWLHVYLDLRLAEQQEALNEMVGVDAPDQEAIPEDLLAQLPQESGTIIVWSDIDQLDEGRWAQDTARLRHDVEKELSRMFRNFLRGGIHISLNGTELLPHDPLFLMDHTWADKVLTDLYNPPKPGDDKTEPEHYSAQIIGRKTIPIGGSSVSLTVTLYPKEVLRQRFMGGDELAKKLRVPENEGAISFVRHEREINYTLLPRIFPSAVKDQDRFIGIEVAFEPELDEYFGVRNVKRGVEPHQELRDKIKKLLSQYVNEARHKIDTIWGAAQRASQEKRGEHTTILEAVKKANITLPKSRVKRPENDTEKERVLQNLAKDVVGSDEAKQKEYREQIKDFPLVVESVDFPGAQFMEIEHIDGQVIIWLNTRHRFYRELWEPIQLIAKRSPENVTGEEAVSTARRTIEALTLLLIAYGKAESMNENPRSTYGDLRVFWGQFTDSLMDKVRGVI